MSSTFRSSVDRRERLPPASAAPTGEREGRNGSVPIPKAIQDVVRFPSCHVEIATVKRRKVPVLIQGRNITAAELDTRLGHILYGTDTDMGRKQRALTDDQHLGMMASLQKLALRMLMLKRPSLTHAELLAITVPVSHAEALIAAANVARIEAEHHWWSINYVTDKGNINFGFCMNPMHGLNPPLAPRYPEYNPMGNPEAHQKIKAFADHALEISEEFTIVKWCLDYVNDNCTTPEEARWLWPAVRQLSSVGLNGAYKTDLSDFLEAIETTVPPKFSPRLMRWQKDLFRRASQYVTAAMCVPEEFDVVDIHTATGSEVGVNIEHLPSVVVGIGEDKLEFDGYNPLH